MTPERKGEVAVAFLKYILGQEGMRLNKSIRRKLGHLSKETGVSLDELTEFSETIIHELVAEHVSKKK